MRLAEKTRLFRLLAAAVALAILAGPMGAAARAATPPGEAAGLQQDFLQLKKRFEAEVRKTRDQKRLMVLSLEAAAEAWGLAADHLAGRQRPPRKSAPSPKDLERREAAALGRYYDSMLLLARRLTAKNNQLPLAAEVEAIAAKTDEQLGTLAPKPESEVERDTALAGALASLMAVTVKSVGGGAMEQPIQIIVKEMVARANGTTDRPDLHYRGKMSLLYANNVQGLTDLTFLLGHNAGPPLSDELARVHNDWSRHLAEASLPAALSLTWTAQCQAVLPLAFWLATHN